MEPILEFGIFTAIVSIPFIIIAIFSIIFSILDVNDKRKNK